MKQSIVIATLALVAVFGSGVSGEKERAYAKVPLLEVNTLTPVGTIELRAEDEILEVVVKISGGRPNTKVAMKFEGKGLILPMHELIRIDEKGKLSYATTLRYTDGLPLFIRISVQNSMVDPPETLYSTGVYVELTSKK